MCKRHLVVLASAVAAAAVVVFVACESGSVSKKGPVKFDTADTLQLTSYMLGRDIGKTVISLSEDSDIDVDILLAAVREAVKDKLDSQLNDSATAAADRIFRQILQARREENARKKAEANKAAGEAFLAANKAAPGVVVTESGLQYIVLTEGTGAVPAATDRVKVHYHGTLTDGKVFDSSVERGEPATFALNGVIRGWTEALQLMKVGSKYRIFVPSDLAYGERGMRNIEPNTVLIFEIELLEIVKEDTPKK